MPSPPLSTPLLNCSFWCLKLFKWLISKSFFLLRNFFSFKKSHSFHSFLSVRGDPSFPLLLSDFCWELCFWPESLFFETGWDLFWFLSLVSVKSSLGFFPSF